MILSHFQFGTQIGTSSYAGYGHMEKHRSECYMYINENNKNKNRGRLDIICEILNIAQVKKRKTKIMYQANLSFVQVERYLETMLDNDLVEFFDDTYYLITLKGKGFLQMHDEYVKRLQRIDQEVAETEKNKFQLETMCSSSKKDGIV
jgi:predicted transcriptional regulator